MDTNKTRRLRVRAGRCSVCEDNPAEPNRTRCESCRLLKRTELKDRYHLRIARGVCGRCGKYKISPQSRCLCGCCFYEVRIKARNRQRARKKAGICRDCPNPAEPGRIRCRACYNKRNAAKRASRALRNTDGGRQDSGADGHSGRSDRVHQGD